jgi:ParB/RepB/Spo0J family partition protein
VPARGGRRTAVATIASAMDAPRSARATRAARAAETWQQLIPNEPGVEDLLEGKRVPLAAIDSNPDQPRKDVLRGIEELASSIEAYGLLQPIVVNPPIGGRYTCIAGHRRLAAYRYLFEHHAEPARWATIPAIERDTATEDRMVLALLENLSRQDLTDAEIITGLRVLHDLRGWHQAEIARRLGVSRAWITQYFRVAADSTVSEHVQTRRLSAAKAYEIVRADTPQARTAALDAALQGAARAVIRQLARPRPGGAQGTGAAAGWDGAEDGGSVGEHGAPGGGEAGDEGAASGAQRTVATAAADAGVRDLVDLGAAMGVTGRLRDLQVTKLIRSALEAGTDEFDAAAFLRLVRADVRYVEAMIRAAAAAPR